MQTQDRSLVRPQIGEGVASLGLLSCKHGISGSEEGFKNRRGKGGVVLIVHALCSLTRFDGNKRFSARNTQICIGRN